MKIALFGKGKMGMQVEELALQEGHTLTPLASADVCIDFSHPSVVLTHVKEAVAYNLPIVIGTTGWEKQRDQIQELVKTSQIGALFAPNFSLGILCFIELLKQARSLLKQYEIAGVEYHHSQKQDAPSGTAIAIAQALNMKTPFTSVRCGNMAGKHEVFFHSLYDTLTFSHEAHSRVGFAKGSLEAAEWIQNKQGWYTLDDMLRNLYSSHHTL